MEKYRPEAIYIDQEVKEHWLVQKITDYYTGIPATVVSSSKEIEEKYIHSDDPITEGKKHLFLTSNRGSFVKKCPGTNGFICCNYYVIDLIENCPLECSYCFLQNYLSERMIKIYVNVEDMFTELDTLIADPKKFYRIGTGELSDSLALDEVTSFSSLLVQYFADKPNALLELKTKSNAIGNLLSLDPRGQTIISWSLNPDRMIQQEEPKTSRLKDRIGSAFQCQEKGYQLAFHFDPIFYYDDWKKDYQDLIDQLFDTIDSNRIAWISLGGFRYNQPFQRVLPERFPESRILYQEFLESPDGKMRYFIKIREQLYQTILSMLKEKDTKLFTYLCMEGKHVWSKVYGFTPKNDHNLDRLFRQRQSAIHGF